MFLLNPVDKLRSSIPDFPIINMVGSPLVRVLPRYAEHSFNRIQCIAKMVIEKLEDLPVPLIFLAKHGSISR